MTYGRSGDALISACNRSVAAIVSVPFGCTKLGLNVRPGIKTFAF